MTGKRVVYLGEVTGDNLQISIPQLLEMIERHYKELESRYDGFANGHPRPVGMFAVVIAEKEDGGLELENFRCGLPKFVEVAVITRTFLRTVGAEIRESET